MCCVPVQQNLLFSAAASQIGFFSPHLLVTCHARLSTKTCWYLRNRAFVYSLNETI